MRLPQVTETWRVSLPSVLEPDQAVPWLREQPSPVALVGEWLGGGAILGSHPALTAGRDQDPFALLNEQPSIPAGDALVGGGWIGWLGYGLGSRLELLPPPPPAPIPRAPFALAYYDHIVLRDEEGWWFEALASADREPLLRDRLEWWRTRLAGDPPATGSDRPGAFHHTVSGAAGHVAAVADCRERIAAGELFQANLCLRLEACYQGHPVDLFARALPGAHPRFGAFMEGVVSLSPERFLRRRGRTVQAEPIKGTTPRSGDAGESESNRAALLASAKDAAENVMIVDLMRNDLGRVCRYGSIVAQAARIEAHAGVWHLVSTVTGELRDGVGDGQLLRATFPPGSVTGAPKVQSMKVIATLEATRRELYTGAIGIASPLAGLDLSVAIRTFETAGGSSGQRGDPRIWIGVGGGIVADSDPDQELQEAITKARGPIAAIGGRLAADIEERRVKGGSAPPVEPALVHGQRPDPMQGVFETLLVEDGQIIELDEHLERLACSVAQLYGWELDRRRTKALAAATVADGEPGRAQLRRARLRIIALADASLTASVANEPAPAEAAIQLAPFALPGGLGRHKWVDRGLLQALAAVAGGAVPLLIDTDGLVLEAAHANVWIREGEALITPVDDGRILPGVTRSRWLAAEPGARAEPITLERLEAAEGILLSSSIAGRRAAVLASRAESMVRV